MNRIKSNKLYWASFNHFEFRIPGKAINEICHFGLNDEDVANWSDKIKKQIKKDNFTNRPTPEKIKLELKEYGSWDNEELENDNDNFNRLIWIAAWNIFEDEKPDYSKPVRQYGKRK